MPPEAEAEDTDDQVLEEGAEGAEDDKGGAEPKDSEEAVKVASLMGWKPEAEWKGDKSNWRSATDFLKQTPEMMRATRQKADRLEGTVARITAQVAKLDSRTTAQADADVRAQARELMEAGKFDEAEKLLTEGRPKSTVADPDEHPALTAFKSRNDWYGVDDEATAYTAALDTQYAKAAGGVQDPEAHMRKVEAGVKKRFPELFGEKKPKDDDDDPPPGERRRGAPIIQRGGDRGGGRARIPGERTVADLTTAEKRAADQMGVSHADYVKSANKLAKAS